jgi:hypothetical protein
MTILQLEKSTEIRADNNLFFPDRGGGVTMG